MQYAVIEKQNVFFDWKGRGVLQVLATDAGITLRQMTKRGAGEAFFSTEEAGNLAVILKGLGEKTCWDTHFIRGQDDGSIRCSMTQTDGPCRHGACIAIGVGVIGEVIIELESSDAVDLSTALLNLVKEAVPAEPEPQHQADPEKTVPVTFSDSEKAKCWDWFTEQRWSLQAVSMHGYLIFHPHRDLEAHIFKQGIQQSS
ncbi:hypothetical protein [Pseudomonas putida]|uniref:Uncharacterized protein n=1 Tax=Pseudomonas putida TaxID=303 RepID=A0A8I1EDC4_PSEPU|nr:hypothetical protein [Pseudomonas putida]MBI6883189.1 hypothetical protein [Pseudomonas putida]